jgi:tripartite-type tricarboxylate transporter receptor subunit TctC
LFYLRLVSAGDELREGTDMTRLLTSSTVCRFVGALVAAMLCTSSPSLATDPAVEAFYRGREVRFVLSGDLAGGYGTYAKTLQPFLEKHIPGKPRLVIQLMPGAGGLVAANWLANVAPKDGSVIAMVHRSAVSTAPLFGVPNTRFDPTTFGWIGSMNSDISVCVAWHSAAVKTFADLKTKPSVFGGVGAGSDIDMAPNMLNNLFDTKMQLVTGYGNSNGIHIAMERGEVDGRCGWAVGSLLATKPDWLRDRKINVLVQIGLKKHRALPDVPLLRDMTADPELQKVIETIVAPLQVIARPLLTAPGVPPERLAALRKAFDEAMADPEFQAQAERIHLEYDHVSAAEVEDVIRRIYAMPKPIIAAAADAMQRTDKLKVMQKDGAAPSRSSN